MAAQSIFSSDIHQMNVRIAPEPNDINWEWISRSTEHLYLRKFLVGVGLVALFFFWSIPVTVVSALLNLDNLARIEAFSGLISFLDLNPALKALLANFLPTLVVVAFMALLPYVLFFIFNKRGSYVRSHLERRTLSVYWLFLLLNVLLVSALTGSLFDILAQLIQRPDLIVSLFAASLPSQSSFFINYILIETLINYSLELSRVVGFFVCKLKQIFICKTETEKSEAEAAPPYEFYIGYARHLLIFTMALTYSSMAPIVNPVAAFHFLVAWFTLKHGFIFVYRQRYYGMANATPMIIWHLTIALFIYQLTMLGVFGLKLFPAGVSIFALLIATALFSTYLRYRFLKPGKFLSLVEAAKYDLEQKSPVSDKKQVVIIPVEEQPLDKEPEDYTFRDPALLPVSPIPDPPSP